MRFISAVIQTILGLFLIVTAYVDYLSPAYFPKLNIFALLFPIALFFNLGIGVFVSFFNWKQSLLSVCFMLLCWQDIKNYLPINISLSSPPANSIKILSYNTLNFGDEKETKKGMNSIAKYLQDSQADIILLQEAVSITNPKWYQHNINPLTYTPYKSFKKDNGNVIALFSRFPILKEKLIFSHSGNMAIAYYLKINTDTVVVINNHLESFRLNQEEVNYQNIAHQTKDDAKKNSYNLLKKLAKATSVRAWQADSIKHFIETINHPLIVAGDFNDTPVSYTYRVIRGDLNDAFLEAGNGFGYTLNKTNIKVRIDHILHSKHYKAYSTIVDKTQKNSDHYPIYTYLERQKDL